MLHNLASGGHVATPRFGMAIAQVLHDLTAQPVLHNLASTTKPVLHNLASFGLALLFRDSLAHLCWFHRSDSA